MALPLAIPALIAGGSALLGGISGMSSSDSARNRADAQARGSEELQEQIRALEAQRMAQLGQTYGPLTSGFAGRASDYMGALDAADYSQFDMQAPGAFDFDMEAARQAELNPALDSIIARATGAVESSAANRGQLFSGATLKGIGRSTADIQAQEWDRASGRAQQQYTNKYQEYINRFNQALQTSQFNRDNMSSNLSAQGQAYGAQAQLFGQQQGQVGAIQGAADTGYMQQRQNQVDAQAARAGVPGGASSFISGMAGGLSGALPAITSAFGGGK